MTFARIEMLYFIWAVPFLLGLCVFGMHRRRSILARFAVPRNLATIAPRASSARRWIKIALTIAALLFAAVTLAGPQYGYRWEKIERKGVDLILAIDCSRSMLAPDIQPNRLVRAKREVLDLLDMLQGDRIGLVAFAGTAFLQCPLTLDYQAVPIFLNALTPDFLPIGGTDMAAAIETATAAFDPEAPTEKAIILITDGEATGADPKTAAATAAKNGIKLFCIGVGSDDGVPIPDRNGAFMKDQSGGIVLARLNEPVLQQIAMLSGAAYVRSVAGDMDLKRIYREQIRGKMKAVEISGGKRQIRKDRYQWFLAVAVVLLLLEYLLPAGRRKKALSMLFLCLLVAGAARASDLGEALRQGTEAYQHGDFAQSMKHFTEAQVDAPDRPEIVYNLGNAAYRAGDYETARNQYGQVISNGTGPVRQKAYYNLGNTSFRLGQPKEALQFYDQALKLDPEDQQARENIEYLKRILQQQQPQPDSQSDESKRNSPQQSAGNDSSKPSESAPRSSLSPPDQPSPGQSPSDPEPSRSSKPAEAAKQMPEPAQSQGQENHRGAAPRSAESADTTAGKSGSQEPRSGSPAKDHGNLDHMLNRLQDKPGAAALPRYGKHQVEKDW